MLVDLLDSSNYLLVNVSLINILGLRGAVYCSELFVIVKKAIKKKKLVNSVFVKVDRAYIESRTGVSASEQLAIEDKWQKMDLIEKRQGDEDNVFNINVGGFLNLISGSSGENKFTDEELNKLKAKLQLKTPEQEQESKRRGIAKRIKNSLACTDIKIKDSMCKWVDAIYESKKTLSLNTANMFLTAVEKYADGDASVAVEVIEKGIANAWIEPAFAIKAYEESTKQNPTRIKMRRATKKDISGGKKF